jgi:hypothetical protein
MKTILNLLLLALLVSSNGCMTYSVAKEAQGRHDQASWMGNTYSEHDDKSHPAYYLLMQLTFPADVAISPIEGIWWYLEQMGARSGG